MPSGVSLVSQGIVVKCTAAIFSLTVDCCYLYNLYFDCTGYRYLGNDVTKGISLYNCTSHRAHQAGAHMYLCFLSMKRLGEFLLPPG